MLAHDHLSKFRDPKAKQVIESRSLIGMYVPTRLEWVGGLRNKPWHSEKEAEHFFQWRLNISTCAAFLKTLRSCLDVYIEDTAERAKLEMGICESIHSEWSDQGDGSRQTVRELEAYLEDLEYAKQAYVTKQRVLGAEGARDAPVGVHFDADLFVPLRRAITWASRKLELPTDCNWMLCLDEAEFLDAFHHRILNSHLRAFSGNLVFKITTMPYYHRTLETNTGVPLSVGHDFEYVYIDRDAIRASPSGDDNGVEFARQLVEKRAAAYQVDISWGTVERLLGRSKLLDSKASTWEANSQMMRLLKTYGSKETLARANRLAGTQEFKDQISRKMHGALLLRDQVAKTKGRGQIDLYAGTQMAIRCSDANPRRLIRILNGFFSKAQRKGDGRSFIKLSDARQTAFLTEFSVSTLSRVQSEPVYGKSLYEMLRAIGEFMRTSLHEGPLQTDQISSVHVDENVTDREWETVKLAVSLGLLFPNVNASSGDQMPERTGAFHLSYVLAPYFRIMPRRGKARRLSSMVRQKRVARPGQPVSAEQLSIFDAEE
ncbi:MAG: hypothetical protein WDZ63_13615 [Burkholderiales bacterium]